MEMYVDIYHVCVCDICDIKTLNEEMIPMFGQNLESKPGVLSPLTWSFPMVTSLTPAAPSRGTGAEQQTSRIYASVPSPASQRPGGLPAPKDSRLPPLMRQHCMGRVCLSLKVRTCMCR